MKRTWVWFALLMTVAFSTGAEAQGEASTIYLRSGGKVRGEIVVDLPDRPLTVMVGNQTMEFARDTIERIEGPMVTTVSQPAPQPVVVAPVAPMTTAPQTQLSGTTTLVLDRRGRAEIDSNWPVEVKSLVTRRNDTTVQMNRKGYGGPIIMMGVGAATYVLGWAASRIALNSYEDCLMEEATSGGDLLSCKDRGTAVARAGYVIGSGLVVGGSVFFWMRWARKNRLRSEVNTIDMNLRQMNVVPLATRTRDGWLGGAALRATF